MSAPARNTYLLPAELLIDPPACRDGGIPYDVEMNNRKFMCEVMCLAGVLLDLPQNTIATAQVLLHRFLYRVSMLQHPLLHVGMTCVLLASKVEETPRQARDIFNVFDRVLKKRFLRDGELGASVSVPVPVPVLDLYSDKAMRYRDEVERLESVVLRELGYKLFVDHPHKYLLSYVRVLEGSSELAQHAWNLCNDSMRSTLCVRFPPEVTACSCLVLAARLLQIPLPDGWTVLFGVEDRDVHIGAAVIAELYTHDKLEYICLEGDPDDYELLRPPAPLSPPSSEPIPARARAPASALSSNKESKRARSRSRSRSSRGRSRRRGHGRSRSRDHSRSRDQGDIRNRSRSPSGDWRRRSSSSSSSSSSRKGRRSRSRSRSRSRDSRHTDRRRHRKHHKEEKRRMRRRKKKSGRSRSRMQSRTRSRSRVRSPSRDRDRDGRSSGGSSRIKDRQTRTRKRH